MPCRVVIELSGPPDAQWSEVYYSTATDPVQALVTPQNFYLARAALLHPTCQIVRLRASDVLQARRTAVRPGSYVGVGPLDGGPMMSGADAVLALAGSSGGSRKLSLRGLPALFVVISKTTGRDEPPPAFLKALAAWSAKLKEANLGILRITPLPAVGTINKYSKWKISQADGSAGDGTTILTVPGVPGFTFPGQVIIGGASKKDAPALNGRYSMIAFTPGATSATVKIPYATPNNQILTKNLGYVRQLDYLPVSVFTGVEDVFSHYGTRGTKVPLFRSRGAKRAARIRELA